MRNARPPQCRLTLRASAPSVLAGDSRLCSATPPSSTWKRHRGGRTTLTKVHVERCNRCRRCCRRRRRRNRCSHCRRRRRRTRRRHCSRRRRRRRRHRYAAAAAGLSTPLVPPRCLAARDAARRLKRRAAAPHGDAYRAILAALCLRFEASRVACACRRLGSALHELRMRCGLA